ncbi:WD40-repeat-containing domain protein [Phycomyces nitens]|nr:WD40-repeat-containing domain protein [Phycomyces nitens]
MSVYNHRPMVSAPQNRIIEMLETIRADYDQLSQDAYLFKSQRNEFELKMNTQIQEMNNFQQSLLELERTQHTLKKQYEDEIARLRQQLEQAQTRAGYSVAPANPPMPAGIHSSHPPPPNIGPGSNYFGGIMNAHNSHQGPGLVAPPQMSEVPPHPGYPPTQPPPGPPHLTSGYPASQPPPPPGQGPYGPPSATNSAPPQPQPQSLTPQQQPLVGQPPLNPIQGGYGYPRMPESGAPTAQPMSQPMDAPGMTVKRKSGIVPGGPPPQPPSASSAPAPSHASSYAPPSQAIIRASGGKIIETAIPGGFADADPNSVPASMKVEGQDWFALFNPKVPRQLKVDLVHTLDHTSVVCCVKFSADGRYLAAGCNHSTFIYDVSTGHKICVLQDESVPKYGDLYIRSVCFSPDGVYLATGAEDKQIRIWDIGKQKICNVLKGHEQDIYSLDFSMDGRIIASGSGDCTARIWSMADGKCLHVLRINDLDQKDPGVTSVAISPDGRLLAAGSLDKMVRIWDTQAGTHLERLEGHKDSVYSVAFMPDGNSLVSGSLDKTLKIWQLGTNEGRGYGVDRDRSKGPCKNTFVGHKDFVLSVACTPDGSWVVSGSKDRGVQFWDPRTGQTQFMLQGHKNSVISVAISPSGRPVFATGSGDNRARIWSYETLGS